MATRELVPGIKDDLIPKSAKKKNEDSEVVGLPKGGITDSITVTIEPDIGSQADPTQGCRIEMYVEEANKAPRFAGSIEWNGGDENEPVTTIILHGVAGAYAEKDFRISVIPLGKGTDPKIGISVS